LAADYGVALQQLPRAGFIGNEAIRRAYASAVYSMTGIARYFGVHISTVSRIARSVDAKVKT